MKKIMLFVVTIALAAGVFFYIASDNKRLQREVYELLEKDYLTQEEKDRVDGATDPDIMKEGFVVLDEEHAKLFKEHFGRNR